MLAKLSQHLPVLPQWRWPRIQWSQFKPSSWLSSAHAQQSDKLYDATLLTCALMLMAFGLVMVLSASAPEASELVGNPYHFASRHALFLVLALVAAAVVLHTPVYRWQQGNPLLLLVAFVLLVSVLIIGRTVNGSLQVVLEALRQLETMLL